VDKNFRKIYEWMGKRGETKFGTFRLVANSTQYYSLIIIYLDVNVFCIVCECGGEEECKIFLVVW